MQFATSYLYRGECGGIREITESYNHCTAGAAEVNMAQILRGKAKEYLSHIHLWQAKARWFYSLYSDLQVVFGELVVVFGKLVVVFGELEGVFEITWQYGF